MKPDKIKSKKHMALNVAVFICELVKREIKAWRVKKLGFSFLFFVYLLNQ